MVRGLRRTDGCACPPNGAGAAGNPIGITARRDPAVIAGMPFRNESALSALLFSRWDSAEA
jgi:hypothetical protein